jgi:hypothetical protein
MVSHFSRVVAIVNVMLSLARWASVAHLPMYHLRYAIKVPPALTPRQREESHEEPSQLGLQTGFLGPPTTFGVTREDALVVYCIFESE